MHILDSLDEAEIRFRVEDFLETHADTWVRAREVMQAAADAALVSLDDARICLRSMLRDKALRQMIRLTDSCNQVFVSLPPPKGIWHSIRI